MRSALSERAFLLVYYCISDTSKNISCQILPKSMEREFTITLADVNTGLVLGSSRKLIDISLHPAMLDNWISSWKDSFLRGSCDDSRDIVIQITCRNVEKEIKLPF